MAEGFPDSGAPEDYTEEQLQKLAAMDKEALTKNQKAAVARWKFKQSPAGQAAAAKATTSAATPGAAPAGPALELPPAIQELMKKDPATLTQEDRIAIGKAKSEAARAQMAAKAAGAEAKPAGPSAEDLAREKARAQAMEFPYVKEIRDALPDAVTDVSMQTDKPYLLVRPKAVFDVLRYAKDVLGFDGLQCLTAADYPPDRIEVVYNLFSYRKRKHLAVKASVPREGDACAVPSVTPLYPGANWLEREVLDLFGVKFPGHPYPRRLLLPEGWVGHPLRKDYDLTKEQYIAMDERGDDTVSFDPKEGW